MPFDGNPTDYAVKVNPKTINAAAFCELADFMERHRELDFDMWCLERPECGTAGCVAGFGLACWPSTNVNRDALGDYDPEHPLCQKLGLRDRDDMWCLFDQDGPRKIGLSLSEVTRADAIATLRHSANVGRIEWVKA